MLSLLIFDVIQIKQFLRAIIPYALWKYCITTGHGAWFRLILATDVKTQKPNFRNSQ